MTPFEVSFFPPTQTGEVGALWYVNRAVDLVFALDLIVQFNLIVEVTSESMAQGTTYVIAPMSIARTYIRGWFLIDFVSVACVAFDFIDFDETAGEGGRQPRHDCSHVSRGSPWRLRRY